jgi:Uncharacterized conserved protein
MSIFNPLQIQVGVSACLLGQQVRFDGGHKRSEFVEKELSRYFSFIPVCPELAIGLGVPRKAIRLVKRNEMIHVEASDGSFDVTEKLTAFAQNKTAELGHLAGYILCAKSPSCGMERVRVYSPQGSVKEGRGVFARILMAQNPLLPVEEDGRLCDPILRENFVTRVFAYHDWLSLKHDGITRGKLIAFHSRYKYLLFAHQPSAYKALGKLLGDSVTFSLEQLSDRYISGLMQGLQHPISRKNHTNVLQHLQGYFKKQLTPEQKTELHNTIDKYRRGLVPLMVPMILLQHYLREYPNPYLTAQVYLNPHPEDLALRYGL